LPTSSRLRREAEVQHKHATSDTRTVTFDSVVKELRKRDFAVLSTVTEEGTPYSVAVNYGVSLPGAPFGIYLMTRRHLKKVRNIVENPNVSVVVPVTRRLLWFLPPPSIHFQGTAEILDWKDEVGTRIFESFFMGRQILRKYKAANARGETRICFVRITPDEEIFTYMVGYPVWEMSKRMESGAVRVKIPPGYAR
jgi:nitroimidazol reductase NimA-like FMN-containing flavoprotein (pyridoxamine 5'-phosphate oxidase superfamily)